jgi:hypothetical protein
MRPSACVLLLSLGCGLEQPESVEPTNHSQDGGKHDSSIRDATAEPQHVSLDAASILPDAGFDVGLDAVADALACSNNWVPCGFPNACSGCCVDGICIPKGVSCGLGMPVCVGPSCGDAGAVNEPCVSGQAFTGEGVTGNSSIPVCTYETWTGCTDTNAACTSAGTCVHCGLAGAPCCGGLCAAMSYCDDTGVCNPACGSTGQPCCDGNDLAYECNDGGACLTFEPLPQPVCEPGGSCRADAGACTTCGNNGQACCDDGGCNATQGNCTSAGTCVFVNMK